MPAPDKQREIATEDWQVLLSPSSIALRSGAVMAFFTAIIAVASEVPLVHAITRTMVALVIFTALGWLAGYFITSLDFEAFQASAQAGPVAQPFVLSPSGLAEHQEEDVLSEDVFEIAIPPGSGSFAPSSDDEGLAALPAGGATEVLKPQNPTQAAAAEKKQARNAKSRKLVLN